MIARLLAVVALALLLAATGIAGYARWELADGDAFARRVTSSLEDPAVRETVATRVVGGLAGSVAPQALVAAPLVSRGVAVFAGTPAFRRAFLRVVRERHRALSRGERSVAFEVLPAKGALLEDLRGLSPRLANAIPRGLGVSLVTLRPRSFELTVAHGIARLSDLFWPLLALSLLALAATLFLGLGAALETAGLALLGGGLLVALTEVALGALVVAHGSGALDLDPGTQREALRAVYASLLGDLRTAGLLAALAGVVLAALPGGGRLARGLAAALAALRAGGPSARRVRAPALVLLGAALVLEPGLALRAVALLAGVLALAYGLSELLGRPSFAVAGTRPGETRGAPVGLALAVLGVVVAFALALLVLLPAPGPPATAAPEAGCNGSPALCDRPLNEVVFPATHNSYAAADEPGWYFPNQRFGVARQLRDGIRGFLLDSHYGVRDPESGRVRTPLRGEGSSRNKVARELGPRALEVADRVAGRVGARIPERGRRVFLCHTLCELGAEPIDAQLRLFGEFLAAQPRAVLVFVVEPYVTPADFERAMRRADLLRYAAVLRRDEPLPTLGELIARGRRLVVFSERDGGARPWLLPAFAWIQDTPYRARNAGELRCARYRGTPDSPLFLVNHWIATFPPPPRRNAAIGGDVLRRRLERCERERRLVPNLVAVDFYERSGVLGIARELNRR